MIGTDTRKRSSGLARSSITLPPLLVCVGRHDLWGGGLSADSPVKHGTVFVETWPPGKWDCAGCGDRGGCVILWAREPMERDETNRYNIQHGRLTFEGFKLTNFSTRRIIGSAFIKLYECASGYKKLSFARAMAEEGLENCTEEGDEDLQIASQDFKKLEETQIKVPASIHTCYCPHWLAKCKISW